MMHSEEMIGIEIAKFVRQGDAVKVLEMFTEREPCPGPAQCRRIIRNDWGDPPVYYYTAERGLPGITALWGIYKNVG